MVAQHGAEELETAIGLRLFKGTCAPATGDLSGRYPGPGLAAGLRGQALLVHAAAKPLEWGGSGWLAGATPADANPSGRIEARLGYGPPAPTGVPIAVEPTRRENLLGAAPEHTVDALVTLVPALETDGRGVSAGELSRVNRPRRSRVVLPR